MKTIGIVGSRSRDQNSDFEKVKKAFFSIYEEGDHIVSGGCPTGADNFAEKLARIHQIPITIHYARWHQHGKAAGFIRNGDIANGATVLICCVAANREGGTEDTIKKWLNGPHNSCSAGFPDEQRMVEVGKLILV